MTENQREAAQLAQRDRPVFDLGKPTLLVGYMAGEPDTHGFQVRGIRIATPDDVKALAPKEKRRRKIVDM